MKLRPEGFDDVAYGKPVDSDIAFVTKKMRFLLSVSVHHPFGNAVGTKLRVAFRATP